MNQEPGLDRRGVLGAFAGSVAALAGCTPEPEPTLRIGTNVWIGSEPLYLARALGHLDERLVRLLEYPSASEVLRAYRNQAVDGMAISLDELFGLAAEQEKPRIVLVIDVSNGADVVVGRPGMKTVKDLKGRRVGVETGALGAFVLSRALALSGMGMAEVQVVHLESIEQPRAYQRGDIDGAVTFNPYLSQLLAAGAVALFDSRRIPGEIVDLVAVRERVLQRNQPALRALVRGWFQAIDYLQREPADAAARMGQRQQTSGAQFLAALQGLHMPSREQNLAMIGGSAPSLAVSGRRLMALMLQARLLPAPVDIDALLAPGPLLSAAP